jgi:hypothetical protein
VALKALMTALNRNRVIDGDMADKRASIVDSQGAFEWGSPVDRLHREAELRVLIFIIPRPHSHCRTALLDVETRRV